jgi:hypothetical protein
MAKTKQVEPVAPVAEEKHRCLTIVYSDMNKSNMMRHILSFVYKCPYTTKRVQGDCTQFKIQCSANIAYLIGVYEMTALLGEQFPPVPDYENQTDEHEGL